MPTVWAMAGGVRPALYDARMRFTLPSGIRAVSSIELFARSGSFFESAGGLRSISVATASRNLCSPAPSRNLSDPERSLGSRIRRAGSEVVNRLPTFAAANKVRGTRTTPMLGCTPLALVNKMLRV
jgi:hypothetical protein